MSKKIIPIKYTSRDFQSIKNDLVEHAKRYYPNSYKDFNDASFGSLMLDTVSYIGDVLSFYLDYQANESFLDTSAEFENIIKHGKQVGYKFSNTNSSTGVATFYINVPSNFDGLGPNYDYAPILKKGSVFAAGNGVKFILNEDVRFDNPYNEKRPSVVDPATGRPIFYAIKANGVVISGVISSETVAIGDYERFRKITLSQNDIIEILSVFDSEGNEYYEVEYLAQNIIYKSITNRDVNSSILAKEILKPMIVPRRFSVDRNLRTTILQFGASSDVTVNSENNTLADPAKVVLDLFGKNYISSDSFDPSKLLTSDKFGICPSNTTLTITYRYNNSSNTVNFPVNSLNQVVSPLFEFANAQVLSDTAIETVRNSLEIINDAPILGDVEIIDSDELKRRIENSFSTQGRAVTQQDYKSLIYNMPKKFGSIKRVAVYRDDNSLKRNLNMYVLCEDQDGFLTAPNLIVKNNIKTWVNRNKMINDTIDILDGKVVNYGITFVAIGNNQMSKYDILSSAIQQLIADFSLNMDFGEPISISDVFTSLKKVNGLIDVVSVDIEPRIGGVYSDTQFDFNLNLSADKRLLNVPLNVIMELKYPNSDIKGTIL